MIFKGITQRYYSFSGFPGLDVSMTMEILKTINRHIFDMIIRKEPLKNFCLGEISITKSNSILVLGNYKNIYSR